MRHPVRNRVKMNETIENFYVYLMRNSEEKK